MNLRAKTIIPDEFWLIVDDTGKVGNIQNHKGHYEVKLLDRSHEFDSKDSLISELGLVIDSENPKPVSNTVPEYPTDVKPHNSILDVRRGLHLFTRTSDSRCYYAAGWFALATDTAWETVLCPKYIYLQRRKYHGPFHSSAEAELMTK
jgi:hypothetical protein